MPTASTTHNLALRTSVTLLVRHFFHDSETHSAWITIPEDSLGEHTGPIQGREPPGLGGFDNESFRAVPEAADPPRIHTPEPGGEPVFGASWEKGRCGAS